MTHMIAFRGPPVLAYVSRVFIYIYSLMRRSTTLILIKVLQ